MSVARTVTNGAVGLGTAVSALGAQLTAISDFAKLLVALGGVVVVAYTIINLAGTKRKLALEIKKLEQDIINGNKKPG